MLVLVYLYLKKLMNHSQKYSEFLGLISIYELLWACQFEGRWARWPRKRIKNARPPDYHASLARARRPGVTIQGPKLLHEVSKQLGQIRGLAFKLGIWPSAPLPIWSSCHGSIDVIAKDHMVMCGHLNAIRWLITSLCFIFVFVFDFVFVFLLAMSCFFITLDHQCGAFARSSGGRLRLPGGGMMMMMMMMRRRRRMELKTLT